ncbi:MAG: hypothetical protein RIG63_02770 [Coleofasciculus chthonoplastes F3-SA18-01]|uniref:hypothetical protein n=1 Tax=Coleofasciculus chthonoplastes TaxID=64178 RepID=UPI0032FFAE1B
MPFPVTIAGRVDKINAFPRNDSAATRPYRITGLQVYRFTGLQVYRFTGLQVYRFTGLQDTGRQNQ